MQLQASRKDAEQLRLMLFPRTASDQLLYKVLCPIQLHRGQAHGITYSNLPSSCVTLTESLSSSGFRLHIPKIRNSKSQCLSLYHPSFLPSSFLSFFSFLLPFLFSFLLEFSSPSAYEENTIQFNIRLHLNNTVKMGKVYTSLFAKSCPFVSTVH